MAPNNPLKTLKPDFEKGGGLIPAIAQSVVTGEVLMLAYMSPESFQKTLETGEAHYWSRSRKEIWHKGATSGHVQKIRDIFLDCDQDAILMVVEQVGWTACHTGKRSCFHYRHIKEDGYELVFPD
jgi:phosphoribosyl-AMP cyclohydrolase